MVAHRVIGAFVWTGAVVGSVGVGLIPGDYTGESFCGVWGCFPPLQALASLHLLWLLFLAPPAVALAHSRPGTVAKRAGAIVLVFGLLATACVVTTGLTRWVVTPSDPKYLSYAVRRTGYTLATRTNVPAIQLALTGALVMLTARRRPRAERAENSAALADPSGGELRTDHPN